MSLYKIGQWMGHSTLQVTELYAHLTSFDGYIDRIGAGDAVAAKAIAGLAG